MLTSEEYVAKGGTHCPFCGSDFISGMGVDIHAGSATQEITCLDCGANWTDVYKLTHFEVIKE